MLALLAGPCNRRIMTTRCEPSQFDPFPTAAVRGCHILTRKEYLANFEGDTAGWAQYQEDQHYAERGVSLTTDAEERLKTNTWETLGQAKARLFDHIGLSPPSRQPTKFQQSSLRLEVLECRNGGPAASPIWRLRRAAWARHPGRMRAAVSRDRWEPLGSPRAAELQWRHRNGCPSSAPAPGLPK